ncbi:GYF domain-containing protein [Crateriforma conspicua]|uniref:GYF domain-containing protein n=1 Tax=Crateriforma conspicua TaxID=2527996 RepID=A0A5C6FJH2_9PLAN|nr:GYF domain-containing protein [Crateriforma conspicua]TWU62405.1 hypothetical protein V7x_41350 [Crateriforma conspicua]
MGIRFACHHCGKRLNIKNELAGKRGVCPECKKRFRIPLSDADFSISVDTGDDEASDDTGQKPPVQPAVTAPIADSLLDDPDAAWYVRPAEGGQYGPATSETLAQWIDDGRVAHDALVWRDGWPQWRPAPEAFPERVDKLPLASQAVDARTEAAADAGNAEPAAIDTDQVAPIDGTGDAIQLAGDPAIGATRGKRTDRRGVSIGMLAGVCVALVAVLIYIVTR